MGAFLKRNCDILIIPILMSIFCCFLPLDIYRLPEEKIELIENMMDSVLAFSGLATAFLFFAVTFIPIIANNSSLFEQLSVDQKFLERILFISFIFLVVSFLCLWFIFCNIYGVKLYAIFFPLFMSVLIYGIWGMFGLFIELIGGSIKSINED